MHQDDELFFPDSEIQAKKISEFFSLLLYAVCICERGRLFSLLKKVFLRWFSIFIEDNLIFPFNMFSLFTHR